MRARGLLSFCAELRLLGPWALRLRQDETLELGVGDPHSTEGSRDSGVEAILAGEGRLCACAPHVGVRVWA